MENILEEFWYGNINPSKQSTGKSQAIKELIKLMAGIGIGCIIP